MNLNELIELINIEFDYMDITVESINEFNFIINENQPDKFQLAAIYKLLSDLYNGTENILKRICKFHHIILPTGGFYHSELLLMFCEPHKNNCPLLFDDLIFIEYKALLKFRHYVIHGYAFQLDWNITKSSVIKVDSIVSHFRKNVLTYLNSLI